MSDGLREQALAYLSRHNVMTVATCRDGRPWAAAVFYANDGFVFYYLSDPKTVHSQHISACPEAVLTIHEDYQDWRQIKGFQIEAEIHRLEAEDAVERAWSLYLEKYPFVQALMGSGMDEEVFRRVSSIQLYRAMARRVLFIDNSKGFGRRDEVPIDG